MAKLTAVFDFDTEAWMNDASFYASDPSVLVTRQNGDTYSIIFKNFTPLSGAVMTQDGSFNLVDLFDESGLREYRVVI
jgi:hypothetical protein